MSVRVDHHTAEFAVATLQRWWRQMGCHTYPDARRLLITADGGGSNSSRSRLWKFELQKLADALALRISVCHTHRTLSTSTTHAVSGQGLPAHLPRLHGLRAHRRGPYAQGLLLWLVRC